MLQTKKLPKPVFNQLFNCDENQHKFVKIEELVYYKSKIIVCKCQICGTIKKIVI